MKNFIPPMILDGVRNKKNFHQFTAYTMFLDISGFTYMTQELMAHGKEGAEILAEIIHNIFTPTIEIIYKSGGFISSFAGDAFTAIFNVVLSEYPLQAALLIIKWIDSQGFVETKYKSFQIAVRIGLSYGELQYHILDSSPKKVFFFKGEAIDSAIKAEKKAQEMSIVAHENFVVRTSTPVESTYLEDKYFLLLDPKHLLKLQPLYLDQEKSSQESFTKIEKEFLPQTVMDLEERGEFRDIVSCYIGFKEVDNYQTSLLEIVKYCHLYGGYLNKIDFGDKGGIILILFGAPEGKENLFQRAADFSLFIKSLSDFPVQVGLVSGISFSGFVGSTLRKEYTALGNVVNLSARLMVDAPLGEIRINSQLKKELKGNYILESQGTSLIKGFPLPLESFLLKKKRDEILSSSLSPFIGRREETERLKVYTDPLLKGEFGGLVYVDGVAGIGKSRFIANFSQLYPSFSYCYLPCDDILPKPFHPFLHFLKKYFQQDQDGNKEDHKRIFLQIYKRLLDQIQNHSIKKELIRTRSIVGALLNLRWKDSLYELLDAKGRYENTISGLIHLLLALSLFGPTIFVLEDAHCIDSDSQTLLKELTRYKEYPFLLLSLCRPSDEGKPFHLLYQADVSGPIHRLMIEPFDRRKLEEMIKELAHQEVPKSFQDFFWEKSGGNPFYIEQIFNYLQENALFDKEYSLRSGAETIPNGINQLILARIDRLAMKIKEAIKTASVLGREFSSSILQEMLLKIFGMESPKSQEILSQVCQEQIWEALSSLRYMFRHSLIRDLVYGMQLSERRRELHQLAGQVIEMFYAKDLDKVTDELAQHYHEANNKKKGTFYLERAGRQAEDNYQNKKSLQFYEKLLGYLEGNQDQETKLRILFKIGDLLTITGEWDRAMKTFEETFVLATILKEKTKIVDSMMEMAALLQRRGKMPEAFQLFEKTLQKARSKQYLFGIIEALSRMGAISFHQGEHRKAIYYYEEGLKISASSTFKDNRARALNGLAAVYGSQGHYEKSLELYDQSLAIYEDEDNLKGTGQVLGSMLMVYSFRGAYDQAIKYGKRALLISEKTGDRRAQVNVMGNLGKVFIDLDDYDKANAYLDKALEISKKMDLKTGMNNTISFFGLLHFRKGDFQRAIEAFRKNIALSKEIGDSFCLCTAYGYLGEIFTEIEDFSKALEYYDKALEIGRDLTISFRFAYLLTLKADLFYRMGKEEESLFFVEEALILASNLGMEDVLYQARIQKYQITENIEALAALLDKKDTDEEKRAEIHYYIWRITKDERSKGITQDIYKRLLETRPRYLFKKRYQEVT